MEEIDIKYVWRKEIKTEGVPKKLCEANKN